MGLPTGPAVDLHLELGVAAEPVLGELDHDPVRPFAEVECGGLGLEPLREQRGSGRPEIEGRGVAGRPQVGAVDPDADSVRRRLGDVEVAVRVRPLVQVVEEPDLDPRQDVEVPAHDQGVGLAAAAQGGCRERGADLLPVDQDGELRRTLVPVLGDLEDDLVRARAGGDDVGHRIEPRRPGLSGIAGPGTVADHDAPPFGEELGLRQRVRTVHLDRQHVEVAVAEAPGAAPAVVQELDADLHGVAEVAADDQGVRLREGAHGRGGEGADGRGRPPRPCTGRCR
ncbi:MAG: hypothetical protein RML45_00015 [Acetobacteraceae bacterium]|nr:hypothetical protein [Acetobacteraceae bacterium]